MTRGRATGAWMALMTVAALASGAPDVRAASPGVPWSVGDEIGDGWSVKRLLRHPEFVRIQLIKGDAKAAVEVAPAQPGSPWSTAHYRVQPPPGEATDQSALRATLRALQAWEQTPGHAPFVAPVVREAEASAPTAPSTSAARQLPALRLQHTSSWPPDGRWGWLLCGALLLALLALCLARSKSPRVGLGGLIAATLSGVVVWLALDPTDLPTRWLTVLQEGSVASVVASLHGQGHHGPAVDALRWLLGSGDVLPLRELVVVNLALAAANTVALGVLVGVVSRRPALGLVTAAAWALAPLQVNAVFSGLPASALASCALASAVAVSALDRAPLLSLLTLGVAAVFAGGLRVEWGLLGAAAWASGLALWRLPERWRERLDTGWCSAALLVLGAGVIGAMGALGAGTAASAPKAWSLWQAQGGGAVGVGVFTWPLAFAGGWPLGLVLLATLGLVTALRRPGRWTAAPVLILLLQGVYWTSSHGGDAPYEVLRYAALMSGVGAALVALGWRALLGWCEGWRRGQLVWVVMAGLCVVPVPDGAWRPLLEAHHADSEGALYDMPLTRHLQAEGRSLIAALESRPDCVIATVSAVEPSGSREVSAYEYIFFGGSLAAPQLCDRAPDVFSDLLEQVAPGEECVLFHRGLDCHVAGGPDCREEVSAMGFEDGVQRTARPYYDHVLREEPVRLELWAR